MDGLTAGRMVHYVLSDTDSPRHPSEHRPAVVVKVWGDHPNGCCQLVVFMDGSNDEQAGDLTKWKTSVVYSEDPKPGTWHWIERA
jgi:hypothetical protein